MRFHNARKYPRPDHGSSGIASSDDIYVEVLLSCMLVSFADSRERGEFTNKDSRLNICPVILPDWIGPKVEEKMLRRFRGLLHAHLEILVTGKDIALRRQPQTIE